MSRGFTLIELLISIAIIGILSSTVVVTLGGARESAENTTKKSQASQLRSLANLYYSNNLGFDGFCNVVSVGNSTHPEGDPEAIEIIEEIINFDPDVLVTNTDIDWHCNYEDDSWYFYFKLSNNDYQCVDKSIATEIKSNNLDRNPGDQNCDDLRVTSVIPPIIGGIVDISNDIWKQILKISGNNDGDKLLGIDFDSYDYFGYSATIEGNTLVIGARENDDGGSNKGAIYTFEKENNTWTKKTKISDNGKDGGSCTSGDTTFKCFDINLVVGDTFGSSVTIEENILVVGAHGDDGGGTNSGAAYVFKFGPK